jgi:tRNA-uridine 2-sulfurtransferase
VAKPKVYVGMSGGVDSSLAAALLVEQGYDVTGVFMKNWTANLPGVKCPWAEDLADAKRVAVRLGIDFKVFDFEKEYKGKVVDYMIEEYKSGRTPNPDVMCNQEVKFKLFLDAALADGADMIATGHYARVANRISNMEYGEANDKPMPNSNSQIPIAKLQRAVDTNKDQTYFLYRVTGEALANTLFPIGELTKPEVRALAKKHGLSTADKKDSQGICFVGQVGIREFLSQYVDPKPGNIVDKKTGKVLGVHDGAIFYTFGQRHGLDLGGGMPYYVVGKDMDKNEVYVTTDLNDDTLWRKFIELTDLHWISGAPEDGQYQIRVRHRASLTEAQVSLQDNKTAKLQLKQPERAIAPGQSVVIYDGEICLGGGIVSS